MTLSLTYSFGSGTGIDRNFFNQLQADFDAIVAYANLETNVIVNGDVTLSSTTYADVTGLSVTLLNGTNYSFEAVLFYVQGDRLLKAAMGGTATGTIAISGFYHDSINAAGSAIGLVSAFGTTVAATSGADAVTGMVIIKGSILVSGAGTLTVKTANSVVGTTNSVVKTGSYLKVWANN